MSRIGKQPVTLPAGVEVSIKESQVEVKGPKGKLSRSFHELVKVEQGDGAITVTPLAESKQAKALWGLTRSLLANMVTGVSAGFTKVLEINGVGYRAELKGRDLHLALGFSHPVVHALPEGIDATVDKNTVITLSGIDKELLGLTAAKIRAYRPPEPYKGKGVKYADEQIRRKVGKAGVK